MNQYDENFYMITLYDLRCHPIADGVIWFFTEDIEDFQKRWTALETSQYRIEKFLRSKAGELVTDYYPTDNDEEINIVQRDKATIYDEKFVGLENIYFHITTMTGITSFMYAKKINIYFKWLRFKNNFVRVAKTEVFGLAVYDDFISKKGFYAADCCSNPVMERIGEEISYNEPSDTPEIFAENSFRSICYLPDRFFKDEHELIRDTKKFFITRREMDILFSDFTGC